VFIAEVIEESFAAGLLAPPLLSLPALGHMFAAGQIVTAVLAADFANDHDGEKSFQGVFIEGKQQR
jgi:hypothetical protein